MGRSEPARSSKSSRFSSTFFSTSSRFGPREWVSCVPPVDVLADDLAQLVERTDTGVSITTTLKRGTGTRDEDKHVVKGKARTLADAVTKHAGGMQYLENEVLEDARALQPDQGDDKGGA